MKIIKNPQREVTEKLGDLQIFVTKCIDGVIEDLAGKLKK